jgi:diaphanous 1
LNETPHASNPFQTSATRRLQFCVPDEWYRRSRFRVVPPLAQEPSEATIKQLASLRELDAAEESDTSEEGEGTAKQKDAPRSPPGVASPVQSFNPGTTEWRGTVAQRRLSSLFESWKGASDGGGGGTVGRKSVSEPHILESGTLGRKSVSEPQLLEVSASAAQNKADSVESDDGSESELDTAEFEEMLVSSLVRFLFAWS